MIILIDLTNMVHIDFATNPDAAARQSLMRIADLQTTYRPMDLICAYDDTARESWRRDIMPEYKAGRTRDEAYARQERIARSLLGMAGIPCVACTGFEADDCIATLAENYPGRKIMIMGNDKDYRQLLEDGRILQIRKFNSDMTGKRVPEFFNAKKVLEEWGIPPERCVDWQCLVGDSTDGIRGAEGIGPKLATEYLQKYGDLDGVFGNVWQLTEKKRRAVVNLQKRIDVVRQVLTLRRDVPLDVIRPERDEAGFTELWKELEYPTLELILAAFFGVNRETSWKCVLKPLGNDWALVDRESGRFYGRVRADSPERQEELLDQIRFEIAQNGFYNPEEVKHGEYA